MCAKKAKSNFFLFDYLRFARVFDVLRVIFF